MTEDLFAALDEADRERLSATTLPQWLDPMLATLTHDMFSDDGWCARTPHED